MSNNEDNWWSNLTSSAKKQAKKFWSDYTKKMKEQKSKINENPLTFKYNKPLKENKKTIKAKENKKAITAKKKP